MAPLLRLLCLILLLEISPQIFISVWLLALFLSHLCLTLIPDLLGKVKYQSTEDGSVRDYFIL